MNVNELNKKMAQKAAEEEIKKLSTEEINSIAKKEKTISLALVTLLYIFSFGLIACVVFSFISNESGLGVFSIILFIISLTISILFSISDRKKTINDWAVQKFKRKYINNINLVPHNIQNECMGNYSNFNIDKIIEILWNAKLLVDNKNKQLIFEIDKNWSKIYKFSDIINYEVYENGNSKVCGTAGKAFIGGAFFGITGAIIGSSSSRNIEEKCNNLQVVIRLNDFELPQITFDYIKNSEYNKSSSSYARIKSNLQQLCSILEYMINNKTIEQYSENNQTNIKNMEKSSKEQLQELKEMLDEGLITQEEFDKKKKQILGL